MLHLKQTDGIVCKNSIRNDKMKAHKVRTRLTRQDALGEPRGRRVHAAKSDSNKR